MRISAQGYGRAKLDVRFAPGTGIRMTHPAAWDASRTPPQHQNCRARVADYSVFCSRETRMTAPIPARSVIPSSRTEISRRRSKAARPASFAGSACMAPPTAPRIRLICGSTANCESVVHTIIRVISDLIAFASLSGARKVAARNITPQAIPM